MRFRCAAVGILLGLAGAVICARGADAPPAATGKVVLDQTSLWRMFASWNTPLVRGDGELKEQLNSSYPYGFAAKTPPPPADWMQPDFPDGAWSSWKPRQGWALYDYGFEFAGAAGPTLSLMCLRGRFAVDDPAKVRNLSLTLAYRGGVTVYLNGQEVARANLPKGGLDPATLAEDYPPEAFVHEESVKSGSRCILAEYGQPEKYKALLEKRIRRLETLTIDQKFLRKGINVLAVEIHRAPYFGSGLEREGMNHVSVWSTAGLVSLQLAAEAGIAPNNGRPAGIQVWSCADIRRPSPMDYHDPLEKLEPVRIVGCRNGAFDGRIMIASDKPLSGVKARGGELRQKAGKGVIPAANVRLLYTIRDDKMTMRYPVPAGGFWDSLEAEPPATANVVPGGGAAQSILLKVSVPADAVPGDYTGTISVSADGLAATDVPVELKVVGWKLPDPKDFGTHMGIIQSPDSVALQYKVPLWSEEHWKLMEETFKLLGEIGNNYVTAPVITRTNFGNEQSMIRWVKTDTGYRYDFTIFDRYLDLAQKYQKVDVLCLYAFDMYVGCIENLSGIVEWTRGKKCGLLMTLWDPKTGKCEDLESPPYDSPEEFKKFLGPLFREIGARVAKRGLADAMMLGISGDYGGGGAPTKELGALYKELLPGAKWVANPHADCRGKSVGGIPVGYNTSYYLSLCPPPESGKRFYGWKYKSDYHARARGETTPLTCWRTWVEAALVHNLSGRGRMGADFWPVLKPSDWKGLKAANAREKKTNSVAARYPESDWSQLNLDRGAEAILAPGPHGAMPTENFEQLRQGIQECQARISIEKAILAGKLAPDLAKRCQTLLDQRTWRIRGLGSVAGNTGGGGLIGQPITIWYEGAGSAGLSEALFSAAAEVAAASAQN